MLQVAVQWTQTGVPDHLLSHYGSQINDKPDEHHTTKMMYAIDVWYTPLTKPPGHRRSVSSVGVLWQMTKLQRMASLGIVGGMRSTLTDLLDAHTGLLPIDLTLFWICHRAAVRLCSLPPSHPLHSIVWAAHLSQNKKHINLIKSTLRIFKLDPQKFEMISPDTTPLEHLAKIKAIIPREKDKAIIAELKDKVDLKIFTDGSGKDGWAGTSTVLFQKDNPNAIKSLTYHIGELLKHMIEEAELIGALMGIWLLHTMPGSARRSVTTSTQTVRWSYVSSRIDSRAQEVTSSTLFTAMWTDPLSSLGSQAMRMYMVTWKQMLWWQEPPGVTLVQLNTSCLYFREHYQTVLMLRNGVMERSCRECGARDGSNHQGEKGWRGWIRHSLLWSSD